MWVFKQNFGFITSFNIKTYKPALTLFRIYYRVILYINNLILLKSVKIDQWIVLVFRFLKRRIIKQQTAIITGCRRRLVVRAAHRLSGARGGVQEAVRGAWRAGQGPLRGRAQGGRQDDEPEAGLQVHPMQDAEGPRQSAGRNRHHEPAQTPQASAVGCGFPEPPRDDHGHRIVSNGHF